MTWSDATGGPAPNDPPDLGEAVPLANLTPAPTTPESWILLQEAARANAGPRTALSDARLRTARDRVLAANAAGSVPPAEVEAARVRLAGAAQRRDVGPAPGGRCEAEYVEPNPFDPLYATTRRCAEDDAEYRDDIGRDLCRGCVAATRALRGRAQCVDCGLDIPGVSGPTLCAGCIADLRISAEENPPEGGGIVRTVWTCQVCLRRVEPGRLYLGACRSCRKAAEG